MSSLAWIDFDETERQRARRLMALFTEKESRDELGLGPIRDSIADHLFPGTSTIQTRLRYMLFVPWIYQLAEKRDGAADRLAKEARDLEIRLIAALISGDETKGVIGSEAGASLKRLPSSIYWAGLRTWGIRMFSGSQEAYFSALPGLRKQATRSVHSEDTAAADEERRIVNWRPGLPPAPADLFEKANFRLTKNEAGFIVDRLVESHPKSLLTGLAKAGRDAECDFIWAHPDLATFPASIRVLVDNAKRFSILMHGASLLYNLMLAEKCRNDDWIQSHGEAFAKWQVSPDLAEVADLSLSDFWVRIEHDNHRIQEPTRLFVQRWLDLVRSGAVGAAGMHEARELVEKRETRLKRAQSRFVNQSMLNRWGGNSGTRQLSFRWAEAYSHLKDIVHAQ